MIWILSIITMSILGASDSNISFSTKESYEILFGANGPIHATTHITNIIRNGSENLTENEIDNLSELGLSYENGEINTFTPDDLDQVLIYF